MNTGKQTRRRRRRRLRIRRTVVCLLALILCIGIGKLTLAGLRRMFPNEAERFLKEQEGKQEYPQKLLELLENNQEAYE